ncbi:MAG: bifunctional riboflavin kinase/FAD synthetase [Oceanococcus sp.]|nr:MAG: bifunctional riboflavin kinase/FAD synthetase [Oceanococcus sp.]
MRVIRGLSNIQAADRGAVVTLGNFDGVHLGHQALLEQLRRAAPEAPRCLVCFEPQPLEYLRPDLAPVRLQSLSEKLRFLRAQGLEQVLVLRFDQALASMPPQTFVTKVLVEGLGACCVVIGDDWRFGHQRAGDVNLLKAMAAQGGYRVEQLDTVSQAQRRISSTRVREALQAGDLADVQGCLGRNFRLRGRVIHGQKLGRKLGAPTANVALRSPSPLRHGVYCVRLDGLPGVANIGVRPTIGGDAEHLEVHLLEGHHELYDHIVTVEFEAFLRPEQAFADLQQLQQAIAADVAQAQQHFQQDIA